MKRWLPSLVKTRPDLYRAVYDWNVYPHRWVLPVWLDDSAVPAPVLALLEHTPRGRDRLSRHFRHVLNLEETYWDFSETPRRLALLSATTLARLAHFAGAAVNAVPLARVVAKAERRVLTTHIGDGALGFALRRARVTTTPAGFAAAEVRGEELAHAIERTGWHVLAASLRDEPEALRQRFRLKAPRQMEIFNGPAEATATALWQFLQPMLREVLTPEETRCLA